MKRRISVVLAAVWGGVFFLGAGWRVLADCSGFGLPFNDLGSSFCAEIAEAYFSGLTTGTSATTYNPGGNVSRQQMAAFITRTLDQSLLRGNRRAALDQWWISKPHYDTSSLGLTTVGLGPRLLKSDGTDVWVPNGSNNTVTRVRIGDGKNLETWTGAGAASAVLVAMGKVFVTGAVDPGCLYMIDPTQTAGPVTNATCLLGTSPGGIAFDGDKIWTANADGSISIVTPGTWSVAPPVTTGFTNLYGIVFDGSNMWVTDGAGKLFKLDSAGAIIGTVNTGAGSSPLYPAFDGHNIWVPLEGYNDVEVVRASDAAYLKNFGSHSNGLKSPTAAAFDGQRVLVTNQADGGVGTGGVSLFKAADLSAIGSASMAGVAGPFGVCSDGVNFWVSFFDSSAIGRF